LESSIKTLFVKQHLDLLGPRQSFNFIPNMELDLLKNFPGKVSLYELLVYFKADFLITPTQFAAPWLRSLIDKPGYVESLESSTSYIIDINDTDLSSYDLVISHDPIIKDIKKLKDKYPNILFAYILAEHSSYQMHEVGIDYDLFLDHTLNSVDNIVRLPQAVNFLFPRVPDTIRSMFNVKRTSVFFDYRSAGHFISKGNNNVALTTQQVDEFISNIKLPLPIEPISKTSLEPFMFNSFNENDSVEYYRKLCRTKYFVTIANRVGQAAFDAASAGALVIGTDKSELHLKLCHPDLLMKGNFTLDDVKNIIAKLESDETKYTNALNHQENFLSLSCIKHPEEIINKAWKIKTS